MNRLRPVGLPLMLLACAALLYGVNHFGRWHSSKAEGAMWLFGFIAVVWLPFAVYRVSGSAPRFPIKQTLFKLAIYIPFSVLNIFFCMKR